MKKNKKSTSSAASAAKEENAAPKKASAYQEQLQAKPGAESGKLRDGFPVAHPPLFKTATAAANKGNRARKK